MTTKPEDRHSTWLVIVPMVHLTISNNAPINGCWAVGDVVFHSPESLDKFLRPPRVPAELSAQQKKLVFTDHISFAVVTRAGIPSALRKEVFFDIRLAANVLASTEVFYGRRHQKHGFSLSGSPIRKRSQDVFVETVGKGFCGNWHNQGVLFPFDLDDAWHDNITSVGIVELFHRLDDQGLASSWRRQIASAASRLGKSWMSLDLADAFLDNVIGLETLLTRRDERNGRRLRRRIKGMTGWHLKARRPDYEGEIGRIHEVRCDIVHDSDYSSLTVELLLQADMYLANSLLNVVRLPGVFPDKDTMATVTDEYANRENWPTDGSVVFRWFGNPDFDSRDLALRLW